MKNFKRTFRKIAFLLLVTIGSATLVAQPHRKPEDGNHQSIQLALLLDTSNSMDGLIDQAKSQLWKIVNELAAAKCGDGSRPDIQIALYEYGNDRLPSNEGYIRLVVPFSSDLDALSEKLFALSTNGGEEYCGYVINTSLNQLAWTNSKTDLKMIFIAGNEPFTQGGLSYRAACALAKDKGIAVNTIFCGNFDEGINTEWKSGASLTGGSYMSIEQDRKTVYVPTPFDRQIEALNDRLNGTYVYYGKYGVARKQEQATQDSNSLSYGRSNKVDRAISKSSKVYENSMWDLVDATVNNDEALIKAKDEELPKEMKGMTVEQRKAYVRGKSEERKKIQAEIQSLSKSRAVYIAAHSDGNDSRMLDAAMLNAVKAQGKSKNFNWEK